MSNLKTKLYSAIKIFLMAYVSMTCQPRSDLNVQWSEDTNLLSVNANKQKLNDVLLEIIAKTKFEIFVPGDPDSLVTTSFSDLPLNVALDTLLGEGRHYLLDTKSVEITLAGRQGAKLGKKKPDKISQERKISPDTVRISTIDPIQTGERKPAVDTAMITKIPVSKNQKPKPEMVKVVESKIKASRGQDVKAQARYYKVRLQFKGDSISLLKVVSVEGNLIQDPIINRDYLLVVQDGSELLSSISFDDPLIMHSYAEDPNEEHKVLKGKKATVDISVPDSFRDKNKEKVTISVYQVTGTMSEPLTTKLFEKSKSALKLRASFTLSEFNKYIK